MSGQALLFEACVIIPCPNIVYPAVNVRNILAIFLMSGTMGVLTFILEEEFDL